VRQKAASPAAPSTKAAPTSVDAIQAAGLPERAERGGAAHGARLVGARSEPPPARAHAGSFGLLRRPRLGAAPQRGGRALAPHARPLGRVKVKVKAAARALEPLLEGRVGRGGGGAGPARRLPGARRAGRGRGHA
jgi:hypothetical protein